MPPHEPDGGTTMADNFDVKLDNKTYIPDPSYQANSALGDYKKAYAEFLSDPDGFWAGKARELDWIKPWDKVKEWNWPNARWFCGGKLNISANCLDRHVKNGRRNKLALIGKENGGRRRSTHTVSLPGCDAVCQCPEKTRCSERGPDMSVHAPCP
jgi:acetyl-CoA synthetase